MTEAVRKIVMDWEGVTISGDQFVFNMNGSDPGRLDDVVAELQRVARTTYGQYCGVARAMEMIGERWSLLVIRDLLVGPKSEEELSRGLPLIPAGLLATRLREMTYSGVISAVDGGRYGLTDYGRALEDVVMALGRWGAMALGTPRPDDVTTEDSIMIALRGTFLPEEARRIRLCFELRVAEAVVHGIVDHGHLDVYRGPTSDAELVIEAGSTFKALLTGEITPEEALETGQVTISGAPELLSWFTSMFHLSDVVPA